jgi:outer membrane protein assembly factor BamE (lipoprotein component of BamABCDE complex)
MRQEITYNPVVRGWIFLLVCLSMALIWTACQTSPIHDFSKVQVNMNKDDVLNLIGSPVRTERQDGKEKWAYRFWTGDERNVETLRQVTFLNGQVVSVGEDTEEEQRLKDIQSDDEKRAERRKQIKARALSSDGNASVDAPTVNVQVSNSSKSVIEEDFIEQKGKAIPINPLSAPEE